MLKDRIAEAIKDPGFVERFWAKVARRGPDECWLWTGADNGVGYGMMGVFRRPRLAHRISWIIANGEPPDLPGYHGACILHRCDVPACVNPTHLFLGTVSDNHADMRRKGRAVPTRGERNGRALLTEAQVHEARDRFSRGERVCDLARSYRVPHSAMWQAIHARNWKHLPTITGSP